MLKISEWNDTELREGEEDFHINLCRMCHFSGYHFQHKFLNRVLKLIRNPKLAVTIFQEQKGIFLHFL